MLKLKAMMENLKLKFEMETEKIKVYKKIVKWKTEF